jgi:hypothetical protein
LTAPVVEQQICPLSQHAAPQQSCRVVQETPWQGGLTHLPRTHASLATSHVVLQSPQCSGSFFRSTQVSPQQVPLTVQSMHVLPESPPASIPPLLDDPLPELEPELEPLLDPELDEPLLPPLLDP